MQNDYNYIIDGWEAKLKRCGRGEQKWGLFIATKAKWCKQSERRVHIAASEKPFLLVWHLLLLRSLMLVCGFTLFKAEILSVIDSRRKFFLWFDLIWCTEAVLAILKMKTLLKIQYFQSFSYLKFSDFWFYLFGHLMLFVRHCVTCNLLNVKFEICIGWFSFFVK